MVTFFIIIFLGFVIFIILVDLFYGMQYPIEKIPRDIKEKLWLCKAIKIITKILIEHKKINFFNRYFYFYNPFCSHNSLIKLFFDRKYYLEEIFLYQSVEKHLPILIRKYKQMTYKNEYGHIDKKRWNRELKHVTQEVIGHEIKEALAQCIGYIDEFWYEKDWYDHCASKIDSYIKDNITKLPQTKYNINDCITGEDYEYIVAELIKDAGWNFELTPTTGDFGADIIASHSNLKLAIQCKYFSSNVPNKAVQEAYTAKDYYDCNYACVVSNAGFTPAAQKTASKLNVSLLHHDDIAYYLKSLE